MPELKDFFPETFTIRNNLSKVFLPEVYLVQISGTTE